MNRKILRNLFVIILFGVFLWILPNAVGAAYISIAPNVTTANPGQLVSLSISSDCTGKVSLSASNGTVSTSSIWVEGTVSASVTVGSSGSTTITATAVDMSDSSGNPVSPSGSSTITISSGSSNNNGNNSGNGSSGSGNGSGAGQTNPSNKSNNTNLGNLGIRPNDFSGFKPGTTTYNVTVPNNVETIDVYANKGHSGQTISGTGTKSLKEGTNVFNVVVTAENGKSQKTYTINVTREASSEEENPSEEEQPLEDPTNIFGLSSLDIAGITLIPEFQTDVYEYNIDVSSDIDKLELQTVATEANANVEITGNENFQEGENIVTIMVSDANGEKTVTYQLIVNKASANAVLQEEQEQEPNMDWKKIFSISLIALLIVVVIIIIIVKNRKKNKEVREYMGLYNNDDDFEDEDNYNNNFNKMNNDFIDDNYQGNNKSEFNDANAEEDTTEDSIKDDTIKISTKDIAENVENDENNENKSTHIIPDEFFEDDEPPVKKKRSKGKRFK